MMKLAYILASALAVFSTPAFAAEQVSDCPDFASFGDGPDLVLVPGLGSAPAVWDGVKDRLSEEYRVHLVHVAGFAGRPANGDPETILDRSADEIIRYLDCEEIESTAYAGHSMGGFLGLKLAAEHPSRIERLVVVDSLPFFPLIFSPAATVEAAGPQARAMRDQITSQSDEAFAQSQRAGVRSLARDPAFHTAIVDWTLTSDRQTFAGAMHALMTTDIRPELGSVKAPTIVIAAANSFAPKERIEMIYGAAYAGLPGMELHIIENSFHFVMFDQPELFSDALLAALHPVQAVEDVE